MIEHLCLFGSCDFVNDTFNLDWNAEDCGKPAVASIDLHSDVIVHHVWFCAEHYDLWMRYREYWLDRHDPKGERRSRLDKNIAFAKFVKF